MTHNGGVKYSPPSPWVPLLMLSTIILVALEALGG